MRTLLLLVGTNPLPNWVTLRALREVPELQPYAPQRERASGRSTDDPMNFHPEGKPASAKDQSGRTRASEKARRQQEELMRRLRGGEQQES